MESIGKSIYAVQMADQIASTPDQAESTGSTRAAHIDLADWLMDYLEDKNA